LPQWRKNLVTLEHIVNHARNRSYMSGVERDQNRIKETQEVFTPTIMVQDLLDQLPEDIFLDPNQTFIDNSCGDGQFLSEALIRKLTLTGKTEFTDQEFEQALSTIYGVDLMPDNVNECRKRLLCGQEQLEHIVEKNITCANGIGNLKSLAEKEKQKKLLEKKKREKKKEKLKKQQQEKEKLEILKKFITHETILDNTNS
jgi:hypothetical protein